MSNVGGHHRDPVDVNALVQQLREPADRRRVLEAWLSGAPDPQELLLFLKDEAERYLGIDPHTSLSLAEALLEAAGLVGMPEHHALGLMARADAFRCLMRYTESERDFRAAGAAFLALANPVGWARTRIGWLLTAHLLGKGGEALRDVDAADAILREHGQWLRAAGLALNTGWVHWELGEYATASAAYDRAIDLYARAGAADPTLATAAEIRSAKATANKAAVIGLTGDISSALALHRQALDVFVRHADHVSVLRQQDNIAQMYLARGHYAHALRLLGDVVAQAQDLDIDEVGWAELDMAECYLRLNRHAEALDLAQRSLARFERGGTPTEAAKARAVCGIAEAGRGRLQQALDLFATAAPVLERAGIRTQAGLVALHMATVCLEAGDPRRAERELARAHAIFSMEGLDVYVARAQLVEARAALALDQPERAAHLAESGLSVANARDLTWLAHDAHHVLATVAVRRHDDRAALERYEAAVSAVERMQAVVATGVRTAFLADKVRLFHDAIDCCLRLGDSQRALAYLERGKSRALLDYLARNPEVRIHVRNSPGLAFAEELAELRGQHHAAYLRLYDPGLGRPSPVKLTQAQAKHLSAQINTLETRIGYLLDRLALEDEIDPQLLPHPRPATVATPVLPAGTVLVEVYLRLHSGVAFVVSDRGVASVPLTLGSAEIVAWLRRWRLNLDATAAALASGLPLDSLESNAVGLLEHLSQFLIQPLTQHLDGCQQLIFIPYGPLHEVPFHALRDRGRYLAQRYDVSTCPSSSLLEHLRHRRSRAPGSALLVGHSDDGRLAHTISEVAAIADLLHAEVLVDEQATVEAVTRAAPRHAIVHLAAHGEARLDNPTFAHVKLADGQLGATDVFNLELDGALVVLSACETAHAVVAGGDEIAGLSRGFLFAGARTLVQSLWRVDDASTCRLMVAFYRALCAGRAAPAALREAQGVLLDEHVTHPYLWAPFQVVGHADVRRPEDCSAALPSRVSARHDAMELDTAPLAERRDMT